MVFTKGRKRDRMYRASGVVPIPALLPYRIVNMSRSPQEIRWQLRPLHIEGAAGVEVPPEGVTIGRGAANAVRVSAQDYPGVSVAHARVSRSDDRLFLEDLNSSNGTLVDGRRVHQRELRHGDVFELGPGGPRFAALSDHTMDQTALLDELAPRPRFGHDTVELMREELGIPAQAHVDDLLRQEGRRQSRRVSAGVVLIVALVAGGIWAVTQFGQDAFARLQSRTAALEDLLEEQMAAAKLAVEAQRASWNEQRQQLEAVRDSWERKRQDLERHRSELEQSVQHLLVGEKQASGELTRLRTELEQTTRTLSNYDPINLEHAMLERVSAVERVVVMIEVNQTFREKQSGRALYLEPSPSGELTPNLSERGRPLLKQSNGSGFCFTDQGWVLTNAHVVVKEPMREPFSLGKDLELEPHLDVAVVFSGTDKRHAATVVATAYEGRQDLALLKIEPFPGMPHVAELDLQTPTPARWTDVFLIGFPLGKRAIQQGDTVIASTFRGIVSRIVDGYIQVDAAVHPGASGGPLIDSQGNVLGVCVGMQKVSEDSSTSAIGYIIPIAQARDVWPPR